MTMAKFLPPPAVPEIPNHRSFTGILRRLNKLEMIVETALVLNDERDAKASI